MQNDRKLIILTGSTLLILVVLILMPFNLIYQVIGPIDTFLQSHFSWMGVSVGKLGHVVAFCVLTVVASFVSLRLGLSIWIVLATLLAISVMTELAQLLIPGRTTRYSDLLWNFAGIVIGYCCFKAIRLKK